MIKRNCLICGKEFSFYLCNRLGKYCSYKCFREASKGKHHSPSTEFKKGQRVSPKTEFKKGQIGEECGHWKSGITKHIKGYILIYSPNHPYPNQRRYVYEHRLVAEKCLGRYLLKLERIHHIGIKYPMDDIRNKSDNRPENLYLFPSIGKHNGFHFLKNKPQLISNII